MLFLNASQPALIGSYLTPIFALIGVLLGLSGTFLMNRINQIQKKKDDKKNKINNQLQNFYYPFIHLQKKSEELYLLFNNNKEKDFQTLLYLLEYGQAGLTQNDLTLLTKIIEVGQQWSNLILEKSNFSYFVLQVILSLGRCRRCCIGDGRMRLRRNAHGRPAAPAECSSCRCRQSRNHRRYLK